MPVDLADGEWGRNETLPGRKAEIDRAREGISEGFYLVEFGWVVLRGAEAGCILAAQPSVFNRFLIHDGFLPQSSTSCTRTNCFSML